MTITRNELLVTAEAERDAAQAECARHEARAERLAEALRIARLYVASYRDELLLSFCPPGQIDRSKLDEEEAAFVQEADDVIEVLDCALGDWEVR